MDIKKEKLEEFKKDLELKAGKLPLIYTSTDVIFGEGSPNAQVMFIGEAGGYWEAKLRRPFVGNAGKLLDELIEMIGLKRNEVYISNVVKARPPSNRDPLPEEIEAFRPYLDWEIEIIQPKIIVTLGRFSLEKFIPGVKISQVHGMARFVEFQGRKIIVIPMFHPAAALRRGEVMRMLKEDFSKIPQFLLGGEKMVVENLSVMEENEKDKDKDNQEDSQLSLL